MYRYDRVKAQTQFILVMSEFSKDGHSKPGGRTGLTLSAARLAAVQALYQIDQSKAEATNVLEEFLEFRLGMSFDTDHDVLPDKILFKAIVHGAFLERVKIDQIISDSLVKTWRFDRLEMILRAILRAGVYEIGWRSPTPVRVIIAEYVDVSHAFYDDQETGMVNGLLDRIARLLRPHEFSCRDTGT